YPIRTEPKPSIVNGFCHLFTPTMRIGPLVLASLARTLRFVATPVENTWNVSGYTLGPVVCGSVTVKFTGADEAELVWLSVPTAVTEKVPGARSVTGNSHLPALSVPSPITAPLRKKTTPVMVLVPVGVAVALNVAALPVWM